MATQVITSLKNRVSFSTKDFTLTVPRQFRNQVSPGTVFRAEAAGSGLILRPLKIIDPKQSWFWSEEWQEKEMAAEEDIKKGRLSGPFSTAKKFMRDLKRGT